MFTGQRFDQTGLYFYNARYYDATIGRFISPDTFVQSLANPQTLNRYSYCINNPLKYIDPTGHFWDTIIDIITCAYDLWQVIKNPTDASAWLALGIDVGCAILPFVPSPNAAKHVSNLLRNIGDKGLDVVKKYNIPMEKASQIEGMSKHIDDLQSANEKIKKGAERVQDVLEKLEFDDIMELQVPNKWGGDIDILTKSGDVIEVTGPGKFMRGGEFYSDDLIKQFKHYARYAIDNDLRGGRFLIIYEQAPLKQIDDLAEQHGFNVIYMDTVK